MAFNGGYDYRVRVGRREAGESLLDFLAGRYPHSSRAAWRERIAERLVSVDGRSASPGDLLAAGQEVVWHRPPWQEPEVPMVYALLHRDEDLLAVAKPSGLPTVPAGGFLDHTLLHLVRRRYPEASPVHRLGRGTSGIVLFVRTSGAGAALTRAWGSSHVTKVYRALVSGHPVRDAFAVDVPIGPTPHPLLGTIHAASAKGRPAVSHVRVLERREGTALVEVRIETGRPHQIRIHMAAAGHPLAGDPLYAPGGGIRPGEAALPGDMGYRLHHGRLSVPHPAGGSRLDLACLPPPVLRVRTGHPEGEGAQNNAGRGPVL